MQYAYYRILARLLTANTYWTDAFNVYKRIQYHDPSFIENDDASAIDLDTGISIVADRPEIVDRYIGYDPAHVKLWSDYFQRPRTKPQQITITSTTCKRLDLFKKTVNSFLACCLDFNHFEIDKWFVVDDNSSQEDRDEMVRLYPFMTFYFKTPAQKGHARSMNLIVRNVDTPYMLHLEDDWQFYHKDRFLSLLMTMLTTDSTYKQALINNGYAEIPSHAALVGGTRIRCGNNSINGIVHTYCSTRGEQDEFNRRWGFRPNCAYWPHFSFRPGLTDTSIFTDLGPFDEDVWHFEMSYARKYTDKGYRTLFLPGMACKHIGKLTSDKQGINAYNLNEETQFHGEQAITPLRRVDAYYINLDRRPDRDALFKTEIQRGLTTTIKRFSATDGYIINMTPQMYHLFDTNDYNYRKGIVGCALSHIRLWIEFLRKTSLKDMLIVMEDDLYLFKGDATRGATTPQQFEDVLDKSVTYMDEAGLELLFVQYTPWRTPVSSSELSYRHVSSGQEAMTFSMGGTGCYIITRPGIVKLLKFINRTGMTNAIDTVMMKAAGEVTTAYLEPLVAVLDVNKAGDTDIQYNYESCAKDTVSLIKEEVMFLEAMGETGYTFSKSAPLPNECTYTYPLHKAHVVFKDHLPSRAMRNLRPHCRLNIYEDNANNVHVDMI